MNSHQPPDDRELDALLLRAQWPAASDEQVTRLADKWRAARRRRKRIVFSSGALAACLLLAAGALAWRSFREPELAREAETSAAPRVASKSTPSPTVAPLPVAAPTYEQRPIAAEQPSVREPTIAERAVLAGRLRRESRVVAHSRQVEFEANVDELISILATDADADVQDRLPVDHRELARYEQQLGTIVVESHGERRTGAVRLLARIATPSSIPLLVHELDMPATHGAVIVALGRLAGSEQLVGLAAAEHDFKLQGSLLRMLLERRTPEAVGGFLSFVENPESAGAALDAVADMNGAPVELLVGFLESPHKSRRLAAAVSLGRLCSVEVAERLEQQALHGRDRQTALLALLLCHSEEAEGFLKRAREDLYLTAAVYAAERELQALTTSSGGNLQ